MKIAVLNDTHIGVRNSSEAFIDYQKRFFEEVFFPYVDKHNIKIILHLGDLYDNRKYINFKALHASRKYFLEPMRERGMIMDVIPGNHDVFYKSTNELCSLKELLGYFTNNINIVTEPRVMDYDGFKIGLIPWINPENYAKSMKFIEKCKASWIGGHLELIGFELMKGVENTHGMDASTFSRFEKVLTGHFHTKSKKGNIQYLGSQTEFTWADAHDDKFFHVIDTSTRKLKSVRNPIRIFQKILYNDNEMDYNKDYDVSILENKFVKIIVSKKKDAYKFEQFVDKIQENVVTHDLKIVESFDEFFGENVQLSQNVKVDDTPTLLNTYIENVDTDLDKSKLKNLMNNVYAEALNMETL